MPDVDRLEAGAPRYAGDQLRRVRRSLDGMSQEELARHLGLGAQAIRRYEQEGAPGWMPFALIGLGIRVFEVPLQEMIRRVGLDPAAVDRIVTVLNRSRESRSER